MARERGVFSKKHSTNIVTYLRLGVQTLVNVERNKCSEMQHRNRLQNPYDLRAGAQTLVNVERNDC